MTGLPGQPLMWKFIFFLAGFSYALSLFLTLLSGSGVVAILVRPILSAAAMGILGAGIYFALSGLVPEFLEELESGPESEDELEVDLDDNIEEEVSPDSENLSSEPDMGLDDDGTLPSTRIKPGQQTAKEGEILVEGVAIKNEPEVMAEAIQHVMSQDE